MDTIERHYYDDEIDLYELFLILSRRKRLILAITIGFILFASVLAFVIPPKYKVEAIIRPGVTGFDENGIPVNDWKVADFKTWIESKPYERTLISKYGKYLPEIEAHPSRGGGLLSLTLDTPWPEKGKHIIMDVINLFLDRVSGSNSKITSEKYLLKQEIEKEKNTLPLIAIEKQKIDTQISYLKSKYTSESREISAIKEYVEILKTTKNRLEKQITLIDKNTKKLMKLRDKALKDTSNGDTLSLLMYSNVIQNNITYASNLQTMLMHIEEKINAKKREVEERKLRIKEIEKQIKDLELKRDKELEKERFDIQNTIKQLEIKLSMLRPVEVVQPPYSSIKPVKPKKLLMVTVAGVSGLFLGIFLAFFVEWWVEARKKYSSHLEVEEDAKSS